jgi:hypothetical protein
MISSNQQILICIIIGIVIIFFLYNRSEGFVTSTEAVNNIASLYNTGNLTATNISATGGIVSDKDVLIKGTITGGGGALNLVSPTDVWQVVASSNRLLSIVPNTNFALATNFTSNGDLYSNGNISAKGIMTQVIPEIQAYHVALENVNSVIDWGNATGCGGLMSKNMTPGTTKSFRFHYSNGNSWALITVTLIDSTGAYILSIIPFSGNKGKNVPWTFSGIFSV